MQRICHRKLHTVLSEDELALDYTTAFIRWIRRRPPKSGNRHRRPKRT